MKSPKTAKTFHADNMKRQRASAILRKARCQECRHPYLAHTSVGCGGDSFSMGAICHCPGFKK